MEDCWLYAGRLSKTGYADFKALDGGRLRTFRAHRVMYENLIGEIPQGLVLDHLCRVRHCINPAHLEAVTQGENIRRGNSGSEKRTHCKRGHEFGGDNLVIRIVKGHSVQRCKACLALYRIK